MTPSADPTGPRSVVVTGGGSGIGRATARAFADLGDRVLVVGRTESTLAATAQGCTTIRTLVVDITMPDAPDLVVDRALREFGGIDVLVNNASFATAAPLADLDLALLDEQIAVNLRAPIALTRRAVGPLSAARGVVVNLSTAGSLGLRAWPSMSVYGATKVALDFLTRTWAAELAPHGVRVVAVAPGVTDTETTGRMTSTPEQYAQFIASMEAHTPLGRIARPEEIAWWIVQLTREQAGYATGTVFAVDGGASTV